MNTFDYFLKANLYVLLFAVCYWLLLRGHTFFRLNRTYLLLSALLSLTLPVVSLPAQTVSTLPASVPVGLITLPATAGIAVPAESVSLTAQPDWEEMGLIAYSLLTLLFVVRFLIQVGRLMQLIRQSPRHRHEDYVLVQPNDHLIPTFSFFHYVILNPADTQNDLIIQHELVHVRQHHSADIMSLGLLRAIFWACPTLWLIERLLRQVHEFLADKRATQPTAYARFLVDYSFSTQHNLSGPDTLTNSFFNPSLLKQRIIMLHRKATNRWALGKYVLVLPMAFGLLAMTTARKEISAIVDQVTEQTITVSGRVMSKDGKPLSGANVLIANTSKGTPTDQYGFYKLSNVPVSAILAFSHIGYRTDRLQLEAFKHQSKNKQLTLNARLIPNLQEELPPMGATALYKSIKPNPTMPVRTPPSSETVNGKVYTAVEEPAVFPTGIPGLMQYVAHHLRYPLKAKATGIQGDVFVLFTVLPTGAIGDVTINKNIQRIGGGCEEEAIRVVRQMPKWLPARQNNKAVAARYQLPIRFVIEKKEDKRTGKIEPTITRLTADEIVDIPTVRDVKYPYQPMLTMTKASLVRSDTTPKPVIPKSIEGKGPLGQLGGEPLYILDGTPISGDSLNRISPNAIENLNVIKGAAAAAYGEKGKYGVIIITSKKK